MSLSAAIARLDDEIAQFTVRKRLENDLTGFALVRALSLGRTMLRKAMAEEARTSEDVDRVYKACRERIARDDG